MSKPRPNEVSDKEVIAMLMRYNCPLPFHAVRTRFLGSIASPVLSMSPLAVVQSLWDGDQPVFETPEAANEFFKVF
ncbi:MAG: hypothetical protein EBT56_13175 [Betaproteobacteria bacterium]|nr:hypothetical protein [Betaproteobacteria bacterium]